ncbi:hypothetical protein HMPREF9099_01660 [Lachnospiraceae bacterium oral taxon 082 str. F0431]|nr:hypothetical protein HMPREF9099_01660 [Lachnospiraceae bacterium oral taxon 082 str. F0431]
MEDCMIQGSLKKMASVVLTTSMILGMTSMAFAKNKNSSTECQNQYRL